MKITLFCRFDCLSQFTHFKEHFCPAVLVRGTPVVFFQRIRVTKLHDFFFLHYTFFFHTYLHLQKLFGKFCCITISLWKILIFKQRNVEGKGILVVQYSSIGTVVAEKVETSRRVEKQQSSRGVEEWHCASEKEYSSKGVVQ